MYNGVPFWAESEATECPAMKSESSRTRVDSGKSESRFVIQKGSLVFAKEKVPPDLPVCHWRWRRDGRAHLNGRCAWLADGHHREIAILDVVTISARPFLHSLGGAGISHLRLKGDLGLDSLGGLRAHKIILLVEQVQFFKAPVEFKDNKDQQDHADDACHAAHVDGDVCHISILPLVPIN